MRLLVLLALVPLAASAQMPDPLPVTFLPGGAGAGGCYAQWSTVAPVVAYSAPTEQSRAVRTIDAQRRVDANDYSESLTGVLRPGLVRARQPLTFDAVRLGTGRSEAVRLREGDEIEVLSTAGEGAHTFLMGTAVYSGFIPGYYGGGDVEVVRPPIVELWVRLRGHGEGRPEGWLNTAQAGMVEREAFCE